MFRKLSRDYWPLQVSRPYVRVVLALLAAPVVVGPLLLLTGFIFDYAMFRNLSQSAAKVVNFAPFLIGFTFLFVTTLGFIALIVLWSLRKRGRLAFFLAGCVVGLTSCYIFLGFVAERPSFEIAALVFALFAIYFALVMLTVRWVAGIRRI